MTRYNDDIYTPDFGGDFDDQMQAQSVYAYRDGVDRVLEYVESIHAYPNLIAELKWAIDEGII